MKFGRKKYLDLCMNRSAKKIIAKNMKIRLEGESSLDKVLKTKKVKR